MTYSKYSDSPDASHHSERAFSREGSDAPTEAPERKSKNGGYTKLPHHVVDEWMRHIVSDFGGSHYAVVVALVRLTVGYQRGHTDVSYRALSAMTGMCSGRVREVLDDLEAAGIISRPERRPGKKTRIEVMLDWSPTRAARAAGKSSIKRRSAAKHPTSRAGDGTNLATPATNFPEPNPATPVAGLEDTPDIDLATPVAGFEDAAEHGDTPPSDPNLYTTVSRFESPNLATPVAHSIEIDFVHGDSSPEESSGHRQNPPGSEERKSGGSLGSRESHGEENHHPRDSRSGETEAGEHARQRDDDLTKPRQAKANGNCKSSNEAAASDLAEDDVPAHVLDLARETSKRLGIGRRDKDVLRLARLLAAAEKRIAEIVGEDEARRVVEEVVERVCERGGSGGLGNPVAYLKEALRRECEALRADPEKRTPDGGRASRPRAKMIVPGATSPRRGADGLLRGDRDERRAKARAAGFVLGS